MMIEPEYRDRGLRADRRSCDLVDGAADPEKEHRRRGLTLVILRLCQGWMLRDTSGSRFHNISRREGDRDRSELLVYFVMCASSAILNVLPRHDVIACRAGTLPLCLTPLRFPQFQIERLEKRLPHANAGGCFAYHPKPSSQADAQHGAPNVSRDGSVRDLNARQGT
jgi:hypothetical protein